jgi:hypothetical protein
METGEKNVGALALQWMISGATSMRMLTFSSSTNDRSQLEDLENGGIQVRLLRMKAEHYLTAGNVSMNILRRNLDR